MRTLGKFIFTVLAGAIAALLALVFQEPILDWARNNRLAVEIHSGPWSPMAPENGDIQRAWEREGLYPHWVEGLLAGRTMHMARIELRNVGGENIENIRVTTGRYPPDRMLLLSSGQAPARIDEAREILVPSLAPGARATVYAWSDFDLQSRYYFDDWDVFSSDGQSSIRLVASEGQVVTTDVFDRIGDGLNMAMSVLFFLALAGMLIGLAVYDAYVKSIMTDEAKYVAERQRYAQNPSKFSPQLS